MGKSFSLAELIAWVDGELHGHVDVEQMITAVNTLTDAAPHELSFLSNTHYKDALAASRACAVLVAEELVSELDVEVALIAVRDPYLAYAQIQRHFYPDIKGQGKHHTSAVIDPTAEVADDVDIGAGCVIGAACTIGAGSVLAAGCLIADGAKIGADCLLHAGVKLETACELGNRVIVQAGAVIGSDGFGYAWTGQAYLKIPQVGRVMVHDDVEIGANTCIDRGALGDTVIHSGVKLDNLVQIGHNVEVGALSAMASQVGISGSAKIGQGCQIGGKAGVAGHLKIADGCHLAAKTGVISDIDRAGTYAGFPAMPHRQWLKMSALMLKLPEMWRKLKKIV